MLSLYGYLGPVIHTLTILSYIISSALIIKYEDVPKVFDIIILAAYPLSSLAYLMGNIYYFIIADNNLRGRSFKSVYTEFFMTVVLSTPGVIYSTIVYDKVINSLNPAYYAWYSTYFAINVIGWAINIVLFVHITKVARPS